MTRHSPRALRLGLILLLISSLFLALPIGFDLATVDWVMEKYFPDKITYSHDGCSESAPGERVGFPAQ